VRIISGKLKSRRIHPPNNLPVRPTTDRAKESLFNILNNNFNIEGLRILDLFAGTGNISFEFLSRGAKEVIAVENNARCIDFISRTARDLKLESLSCIRANAFKYLNYKHQAFDIIFADPPYNSQEYNRIPELVFSNELLNKDGFLIIEHPREINFTENPNYVETRNYGMVHFSFFETS
jgi:16S rRNA (guanine(966)-N(2))-methyltransferase RsmD